MQEYKNLIVNDTITYQDQTLPGCYIKLEKLGIDDVKLLKGDYNLLIYKSKEISETNPDWVIYPNEIPTSFSKSFGANFLDGIIYEKIAIEIKDFLFGLGIKNITIES